MNNEQLARSKEARSEERVTREGEREEKKMEKIIKYLMNNK